MSDSATSTLDAAREHARRQAGAAGAAAAAAGSPATRPTVPATAATDLPPGVAAHDVVWDEAIGGGNYAVRRLRRDDVVRLTDLEGDGSVQLLVWSAANPAERLNPADTVKVQWQAYLGPGAVLLSDMGRALATLVTDTSGRHDCLFGCTNRATATEKWGDGSAHGPTPNGRDLLVLGAAKHGLGRVDVGPCITLFKGVRVHDDGSATFDGAPAPGRYVELRAELDLLVVMANTPHPLDDRADYTASTVRATAWRGGRPDPDPLRSVTPERERAFENTDELLRSEP